MTTQQLAQCLDVIKLSKLKLQEIFNGGLISGQPINIMNLELIICKK